MKRTQFATRASCQGPLDGRDEQVHAGGLLVVPADEALVKA